MIAPTYTDMRSGRVAPRIDALGAGDLRFDREGVAEFFSPNPADSASCFGDVERHWNPFGERCGARTDGSRSDGPATDSDRSGDDVPETHRTGRRTDDPDVRRESTGHRRDDAVVASALRDAIAHAVDGAARPVVALSGGLDSLMLAVMLRDLGSAPPIAATLVTGLDGYCEFAETARAADALGIELVAVEATVADLVAAVPAAIRAAEVPLYNLHPVTKWVFARRMADLGFDRVITGDGADQVCAHDPGVDYLPVVGAMFAASDCDVRWPFLDPVVVASVAGAPPDPDKRVLRSLARDRLGRDVADAPKRPRLMPPIDLRALAPAGVVQRLGADLGMTPPPDGGPSAVSTLWTTLAVLAGSHL